jgi:hypothetical protein
MSDDGEADEDWDFYPCRVDDAPASIFLNLRFAKVSSEQRADTLYCLRIKMLDKGEHGMGSASEAEVLYRVGDQLTDRAKASGFLYVGRLRTDGRWQLTFYGPSDRLDILQALAKDVDGLDGREVETGSKADRGWNYYREFLLPDAERQQWMQDRRLVEILQEKGDPLHVPRRVDHWLYFPNAEARNSFVNDVVGEGFAIEQLIDKPKDASGDEFSCGAQVHRVDSVELEDIHQVVMTLFRSAAERDGYYDGWETRVEQAPN